MEPHSVTLLDLQTDGAVILQRVRTGELLVVTLDGEPNLFPATE
jgi:antitoxin (DNA-binding transcriptional repressor) of toxin-antitoxin stability system